MGINGLMAWTKATHPSVFKSYSKRWNAPEIRGKRIAIDGTLLTNRFHFAIQDGPLKGKGGLVGWFNLIGMMRRNNIKPVVVFDERGPREWKAPAAAYRLAKRALNLSRRSHEDVRAERLSQWKEAFTEVENLAEDEQMTVRASFDKSTTSSSRSQIAEKRVEIQEKLETTTSLDVADIDASLDRITAMIDTLSNLQSEYLAKSSSGVSRMDPKRIGLSDALKHVTELEQLYEGIGEPTPRDIWRSPPEEEETSVLDEALEQVVPEEAFRESKSQKELTDEEGKIINQFLTGSRPVDQTEGELEEIFTPDQRPAMARLEDLIEATPDVRAIYQRALNMPSPSDHDACRELVIKMGVPVLEARIPYEAEGLAASLANAGLVDFVGTEDSDVLAYEAPLLRNVSSSVQPLVLVSGSELRSMTTLDSKSFLDFCILMGTDASPRIPGIGPSRAYKAIKQYGSIESIIAQDKYRDKIDDIDGFMVMVNNAREVFGKAPPIPDGISLEQGEYKAEEVEEWLRDTHGVMFMSQEQVNEGVELEKEQEWAVERTEDSMKVEEWDEKWDQEVVDRSTGDEVSAPR